MAMDDNHLLLTKMKIAHKVITQTLLLKFHCKFGAVLFFFIALSCKWHI